MRARIEPQATAATLRLPPRRCLKPFARGPVALPEGSDHVSCRCPFAAPAGARRCRVAGRQCHGRPRGNRRYRYRYRACHRFADCPPGIGHLDHHRRGHRPAPAGQRHRRTAADHAGRQPHRQQRLGPVRQQSPDRPARHGSGEHPDPGRWQAHRRARCRAHGPQWRTQYARRYQLGAGGNDRAHRGAARPGGGTLWFRCVRRRGQHHHQAPDRRPDRRGRPVWPGARAQRRRRQRARRPAAERADDRHPVVPPGRQPQQDRRRLTGPQPPVRDQPERGAAGWPRGRQEPRRQRVAALGRDRRPGGGVRSRHQPPGQHLCR